MGDPGPGWYKETNIGKKSKVLHSIPSTDRNLLIKNKNSSKTNEPGPGSYDLDTHLSMCASASRFFPERSEHVAEPRGFLRTNKLSPHPSVESIATQAVIEGIRKGANGSATASKMSSVQEIENGRRSVNSNRSRSNNARHSKYSTIIPKTMTIAPKLKMGVIGTAKRHCEFTTSYI